MNDWDRVVYKMVSKISGEYYIGKCIIKNEYKDSPLIQIINYYERNLASAINKQKTSKFQDNILKIGLENFEFIILDYCNYDERYDKKNIFKKYLSKEKNSNLLLYDEQREYVENLIIKGDKK